MLKLHEVKLSHRGRKTILTTNLKRLIEEKIKIQKWSIEQVAHVVRIAYKTIYNWIDQGLLDINVTDLWFTWPWYSSQTS